MSEHQNGKYAGANDHRRENDYARIIYGHFERRVARSAVATAIVRRLLSISFGIACDRCVILGEVSHLTATAPKDGHIGLCGGR